jgi:hypothetical protein
MRLCNDIMYKLYCIYGRSVVYLTAVGDTARDQSGHVTAARPQLASSARSYARSAGLALSIASLPGFCPVGRTPCHGAVVRREKDD